MREWETHSLIDTRSLTHTDTHTLSLVLSFKHTHTYSHSLSFFCALCLTHRQLLPHTLIYTLSLPVCLSLFRALSLTHRHPQTSSFFRGTRWSGRFARALLVSLFLFFYLVQCTRWSGRFARALLVSLLYFFIFYFFRGTRWSGRFARALLVSIFLYFYFFTFFGLPDDRADLRARYWWVFFNFFQIAWYLRRSGRFDYELLFIFKMMVSYIIFFRVSRDCADGKTLYRCVFLFFPLFPTLFPPNTR